MRFELLGGVILDKRLLATSSFIGDAADEESMKTTWRAHMCAKLQIPEATRGLSFVIVIAPLSLNAPPLALPSEESTPDPLAPCTFPSCDCADALRAGKSCPRLFGPLNAPREDCPHFAACIRGAHHCECDIHRAPARLCSICGAPESMEGCPYVRPPFDRKIPAACLANGEKVKS